MDAPFWHPGGVSSSALSTDGKRLATTSWRSVILWDTATGSAIRRFDPPGPATQMSLAFSPDGRWLAVGGGYSGDLVVWDVTTGKEVHRAAARRDRETEFRSVVGFAQDGKQLVLARRGTTEFVDTRTWKEVRTCDGTGRLYSPVGPTLVPRRGACPHRPGERGSTIHSRWDLPSALALSPDGRTLAVSPSPHRLGTLVGPGRAAAPGRRLDWEPAGRGGRVFRGRRPGVP